MPNSPRKLPSITADTGQYPTELIVTGKDDALVKNEERGTRLSEQNKEQLIED